MLLERLVKATVELQGFRVVTVTGDAGGLVAELAPDRRFVPRCGQCGTRGAYRDTRPVRRFRHVPLWGIPVALRYAPRRVGCPRCAGVHVESMPGVRGKQQMTHALLVTLATWARALPWEQVARLFRCSWGTVATAVEEAVAFGLAHRDLDHLTHIGIDEISRKRGHVYGTNVYDLARKRLVWSGEGRTTDTLNAFFDFLGPEKTAALAGICCDMWQPYIDVIKDRAGQAVLVFDKFHIVSHLMKAVDQVRRDEIREKGPAHKALMHKTRFIWLKNPWNLTEAQHRRLSELEHLNLKINRAYLLKELFAHFWTYRRAGWAKRYLKRWFWWATHSRLPPLRDFAWMLRRHEKDILNYFRMPIDNGTVEGLNNKAKLIIHGSSHKCMHDLAPGRSASAVGRRCGCARARYAAVQSSVAQTAACAGPALGGGPARRQPDQTQAADSMALTWRRTVKDSGNAASTFADVLRWSRTLADCSAPLERAVRHDSGVWCGRTFREPATPLQIQTVFFSHVSH